MRLLSDRIEETVSVVHRRDCLLHEKIFVSAGQRGMQLRLSPQDLINYVLVFFEMCKCVLFFDQIYVNYANGGGEKNTAISLYGLAAGCLLLNFLDMDGRDFSKMRYCLWARR